MAFDNAVNGKRQRLTALANAVNGVPNATVNTQFIPNMNPEDKKVVFIIGKTAAPTHIMREVLESISEFGIHSDVYITSKIIKSDKAKEAAKVPENQNFSFYEHLMHDVLEPVLQTLDAKHGLPLDRYNELRNDLQYTPRQLSEYYSAKGININVIDISDPSLPEKDRNINDPSFIQKIRDDKKIARGQNVRGMQIMGQPLIDAFESHTMNGNPTRIVNNHPGDVFAFPGTNIAFWVRMKNYAQNVWTSHVIDKQIDHGPFLRRTAQALKIGKTLMQDMLGMSSRVAGMIVDDITTVFNGSEPNATPQTSDSRFAQKPSKNYTHATHQDWLDAHSRGVVAVNPQKFIEAIVEDFTPTPIIGDPNYERDRERRETVHSEVARAVFDWQAHYLNIYNTEYSANPPDYDPSNPGAFFVHVPGPYQPPSQRANQSLNSATGTSPGHP